MRQVFQGGKTSQQPSPDVRRLLPRQPSELAVLEVACGAALVIYEVQEMHAAPNWTLGGRWLIHSSEGWISPGGAEGPHRINTAPVESLNNDHVLAPDGVNVFISANDGDLYVVPLEGGLPVRITGDQGDNY